MCKWGSTWGKRQSSAAPSEGEALIKSDNSHADCREIFFKDRDRNLPTGALIKETLQANVTDARLARSSRWQVWLGCERCRFSLGQNSHKVQKKITVFREQIKLWGPRQTHMGVCDFGVPTHTHMHTGVRVHPHTTACGDTGRSGWDRCARSCGTDSWVGDF